MTVNHTLKNSRPVLELDIEGVKKLGAEFYSREHTKPLFTEYNLLAVRNLYHYFCTGDVFKILKFRQPITRYEMYRLSHRETSLALILPERSRQFFYKSALAWNSVYRSVLERHNSDLTTKISHIKDEIKKLLRSKQNEGENIDCQKSNFILYLPIIRYKVNKTSSHSNVHKSHITDNMN